MANKKKSTTGLEAKRTYTTSKKGDTYAYRRARQFDRFTYEDEAGNLQTETITDNMKLFSKYGKKYKLKEENWKIYMEYLKSQTDDVDEWMTLKNSAEAIKRDILAGRRVYESVEQGGKNRIDVASMNSRLTKDYTQKMLTNLGFTSDELAQSLEYDLSDKERQTIKITAADIMNEQNWYTDNGKHYLKIAGIVWQYEFKYNDTVFERV